MAKEPPWKYLAGIDTTNPTILKRCMTLTLSKLRGPQTLKRRAKTTIKVSADEQSSIDLVFQEISGNQLLKLMTLEWAHQCRKSDRQIIEATDRLKRDATFYVRRPDLYKEEFRVAERAFKEGGWVYKGHVVHWKKIPEEELKRSQNAIAKRAKHDAELVGIEYIPDPSFEQVESESEEQVQQHGGVLQHNCEYENEVEDSQEDNEINCEGQDDEADEDYEDAKRPKIKRQRQSPRSDGEEWKQNKRKSSLQSKNKVCLPL